MNLRFAFIVLVLAFIALLLAIGVLTAIRWIRIHHPERANAILAGAAAVVADAGAGWVLLGTMEANWNPDSWAPNNAPITATTILWSPVVDGELTWDDLPSVAATSG